MNTFIGSTLTQRSVALDMFGYDQLHEPITAVDVTIAVGIAVLAGLWIYYTVRQYRRKRRGK